MRRLWHWLAHRAIFGVSVETIKSCEWCRKNQECPYCDKPMTFDMEVDRKVHQKCIDQSMIDSLFIF